MVALALYQPDIPQNLGSILRLCACMGVACHVIEPCGFVLDNKRIHRVAMDYIGQVEWQRHDSWQRFLDFTAACGARLVLLTTKAQTSYYDFSFRDNDILLLGRESAGVPESVANACEARVTIPMPGKGRSLNIAVAGAMALGEAVRQIKCDDKIV